MFFSASLSTPAKPVHYLPELKRALARRCSALAICGLPKFLAWALLAPGLGSDWTVLAQGTDLPVITQQPIGGIATTNEDFSLSVAATGSQPFRYQWYLNGATLSGATSATLLLTNLALREAGIYTVAVANGAGGVVSSNAPLVVATNFVHRIGTGRMIETDASTALPIVFRSNGREQSVSFSLQFDPGVFSNPRFVAADTNAITTTDTSAPDTIGVAMNLGAGRSFSANYHWIGLVLFDRAAGRSSMKGLLRFTGTPTPIAGQNAAGQPVNVAAAVLPQYAPQTPAPVLNPQTGLFEQRLLVSNPGSGVMTNIDLLALNLGSDSATNAITFFNAWSTQTNLPYGDPQVQVDCPCNCGLLTNSPPCSFSDYLACGNGNCSLDFSMTNMALPYAQLTNLTPGESRTVTVEFYVTDHLATPAPQYSLFLADPIAQIIPANASLLNIDSARYLTNAFLVEFSTQAGHHYWIQYADSVAGLNTGQTAYPAINGTGSRVQWIDDGPPKTATAPTNALRFYRVFTEPAQ